MLYRGDFILSWSANNSLMLCTLYNGKVLKSYTHDHVWRDKPAALPLAKKIIAHLEAGKKLSKAHWVTEKGRKPRASFFA